LRKSSKNEAENRNGKDRACNRNSNSMLCPDFLRSWNWVLDSRRIMAELKEHFELVDDKKICCVCKNKGTEICIECKYWKQYNK